MTMYETAPTQPTTLAAWLESQIAADQAVALAAAQKATFSSDIARWRDEPKGDGQSVVWDGAGQAAVSSAFHYQGAHIARHDPARALREVAAKRAILELAALYGCQKAAARALASVYAGNEGWREEWA